MTQKSSLFLFAPIPTPFLNLVEHRTIQLTLMSTTQWTLSNPEATVFLKERGLTGNPKIIQLCFFHFVALLNESIFSFDLIFIISLSHVYKFFWPSLRSLLFMLSNFSDHSLFALFSLWTMFLYHVALLPFGHQVFCYKCIQYFPWTKKKASGTSPSDSHKPRIGRFPLHFCFQRWAVRGPWVHVLPMLSFSLF